MRWLVVHLENSFDLCKSSQYPVDAIDVKSLRIEISSGPFERPLMLGMIFVADLFEKIRVASDASAILRWAGALAVDDLRMGLSMDRRQNLLDLDFVTPTIPEVVFVQEPRALSANHTIKPRAEFIPEFVRRFIQIE